MPPAPAGFSPLALAAISLEDITLTTKTQSQILLTILVVSAMSVLGFFALDGFPILAFVLFVAGVVLLWFIWRPGQERTKG
jgi:hypothetical protein